jgi:phosphinothricin acetyltransferase
MEYGFDPISVDDEKAIIDIFNYYVENSFAAYPETRVPYTFFDILMQMSEGYPRVAARDEHGRVVGFGMLRVHNPMPTFSQVAEVTCFVRPEHTGRGLGTAILQYLVKEAKKQNITSILANISSRNPISIKFHEKNGFKLCGRFRNVGRKNGQMFDVVWMQRML